MSITVLAPPGDNFIYLIRDTSGTCVVIDPGQAEPVQAALDGGRLDAILLTHHHADHRAGAARLAKESGARIWSALPSAEEETVADGDILRFGELLFRVIATPGHTADSVCYVLESDVPHALFSGDTLFSGGCGRIFEGHPAELYHSLRKLADLDPETLVYPGHDYAEENYRFALSVDPEHASYRKALQHYRKERAVGYLGIPTTIGEEHRSNIFLRTGDPALRHHLKLHETGDEALFTELRLRKNRF